MNNLIPHYFTKLAEKFLKYNYFAYEGEQQSFFTLGNKITIKLFSQKIEIINNEKILTFDRKNSATEDLKFYINNYLQENRRIFGWINFEFYLEQLNLNKKNHLLAVFFIPKCEIQFIENDFFLHGNDTNLSEIKKIINDKKITITNIHEKPFFNINYKNDDRYKKNVLKAINEIKLNKYNKIILSRKINIPVEVDFPKTYLNGRLSNNPKRSFLFKINDFSCLGFSPELVLKTDKNNKILTEPLAGTRAFSENENINKMLINDLFTDPKEIFEHAISVKLSCDEISKISKNSNFVVKNFMNIKKRGAVQHLASTVEGTLDNGKDYFDAIDILFPSITATGIPKKEAIKSMLNLDEMPRGLYSGGIGYIDLNNSFELTLVLRSLFKNKEETFLRAGAGIVVNSNPQRELEETNEKLSSILPYIIVKK